MPPQSTLSKAARTLIAGSAALITLLASAASASSAVKPVKVQWKAAGKTQLTAAVTPSLILPTSGFAKSGGLPSVKMSMPLHGRPGLLGSAHGFPMLNLSALPHLTGPSVYATIEPTGPDFSGHDGMTNLDQASAGTGFYAGTNFDLEPPDQGLAVGNYRVVEAVNNAIAVYTTTGKLLAGPTPTNQFFKLAPYAQPGFTPPFGPFLSDVRCYYDAATKRFFVEEWGTTSDPGTGESLSSFIGLAVSDTADPTGTFTLYFLNTTTLSPTGVASVPDYTDVGADANGIYLSSNYFSLIDGSFQGVSLIALSKTYLEEGFATGYVFPIAYTNANPAFSIAPATTPPKTAFATGSGGTEYFANALNPTGTTDTHLELWALTNTSSLTTFNGSPTLTNTVVTTEVYGSPVPATQRFGPTPQGDLFGAPEETLDPGDGRLLQLAYANGKLWTANSTDYYEGQGPTGSVQDAAAYYVMTPKVSASGALTASVAKQGYIVPNGESIIYPTIAVQPAKDNAVFSFTLTGTDYYPSVAYLNLAEGTDIIHLAKKGVAPDDGFTGYEDSPDGVSRWGDYSAAVTSEDGSAWLATEYIPNLPRDESANWGTFFSHIAP